MSGFVRRRVLNSGAVRYYPTIIINGKKKSFGGYGRRKDAEARLRILEGELASGTYGRTNPFLEDYWRQWFTGKSKSLKPSTRADYERAFTLALPVLGEKRIGDITPADIQLWINTMAESNLKPSTIRIYYSKLKACLESAVDHELIERSPCRRTLNLPRVDPHAEIECMPPAQTKAVLEGLREPYRTLVGVLMYSGARLGEVQALRWKDIDFEKNCIHIRRNFTPESGFTTLKTKAARRRVPMMPRLRRLLEYYRPGTGADLLFPGEVEGQPLCRPPIRRHLERALRAVGLCGYTLHSLRHTFASTMIDAGANPKALQVVLGHSSIQMTLGTYGHLFSTDLGDSLLTADRLYSGECASVVPLSVTTGNAGVSEPPYEKSSSTISSFELPT